MLSFHFCTSGFLNQLLYFFNFSSSELRLRSTPREYPRPRPLVSVPQHLEPRGGLQNAAGDRGDAMETVVKRSLVVDHGFTFRHDEPPRSDHPAGDGS
ncbi:hypothetical protein BDV12DRAFT_169584 [Aspergillus spectabilis]